MSGAFLAHGYQAQRLIALDDAGVMVHAMGRRQPRGLPCAVSSNWKRWPPRCRPWPMTWPAMRHWACWRRLTVANAEAPGSADIARVRACLADAVGILAARPTCRRGWRANTAVPRGKCVSNCRQWQGA